MSLHYRDLESDSEELFGRLSKRFGSGDPTAKLVRKHFQAPSDLHNQKRWVALSEGLVGLEHWRDAIQALDNCHTILSIHPYYGNGAKKGKWSWKNLAFIFDKMSTIVKAHGDKFDRASVEHQLSIARKWAKRE